MKFPSIHLFTTLNCFMRKNFWFLVIFIVCSIRIIAADDATSNNACNICVSVYVVNQMLYYS